MENESGFVKQVKLCGAEIPEVREKISDLLTAQDAAKIDLEGAFGEVMIKISSDGENARETVKAAVKEVCTGRSGANIYFEGTPIPKDEMIRIVREKDFQALPENMREAAREAVDTLLHSGDGQLCDVIIDRAALEAILEAGNRSKAAIIRDYAESTVAVANIKIAVRCCKTGKSLEFMKRAMAPCKTLNVERLAHAALAGMDSIMEYLSGAGYAEAADAIKESPSAFERWCDNRIIETIKPQKTNPFSVGPLVAYVIARQNEIKTVRIILTCKQNGLSDDSIRERVREMYV